MTRLRNLACVALCAGTLAACATGRAPAPVSSAPTAPVYSLMTDADVVLANAALDRSLEFNLSGTPAAWSNTRSSSSGTITPLRTWRSGGNGYCREYREVITVGGKSESYTATACREPGGLWRPVN